MPVCDRVMRLYVQTDSRLQQREGERKRQWKVDRVLAIHSLSSTASQGTSNIPFPWLLLLGCNRQAQWMKDAAVVQVSKPV